MKKIENLNHTFDLEVGEIGVTIRKGIKWYLHSNLSDRVELVENFNGVRKTVGLGKIIGYWIGEYHNIPEPLVRMEHNKKARSRKVLHKMMVKAYGKIENTDYVIAVLYIRLK